MKNVRAVCEFSTIAVSKKNQTPSVKCRFKLLEGIGTNDTHLYHDLWLSEKAFERTMETLRGVFGWFGTCTHDFMDHHDMLNGVEVDLAIEEETYNGKTDWKVKYVNPVGGNPDVVTNVTREESERISAEMKPKIMMWDQKHRAQTAAPAASPAKSAVAASPKPSVGASMWSKNAPKPAAVAPAPQPAPTGGLSASDDLPPAEAYQGEDGLPF